MRASWTCGPVTFARVTRSARRFGRRAPCNSATGGGYKGGVPISCVYCGGSHATSAEVRACWQRSEGGGAPQLPDADDLSTGPSAVPSEPAPRRESASAAPPVRRPAAAVNVGTVKPGPEFLARSLVIGPEGDIPAAWGSAPVVVVDHDTWVKPQAVVAELREHRRERRRVVVELHVDLPDVPPDSAPYRGHTSEHAPLHELGPRHELLHDDLVHLIWANGIDARSGRPRWWLLDDAVRLGCTPTGDGETGDVVLPDGTRAWIDGGPLTMHTSTALAGVAVLHRIGIEHGVLRPLGSNDLPDTGSAVELAPDQRAAVTHPGSAARIIAPAGSGKTRVLTERARHVVQRWEVPASAVTLVAFNKRAQGEMAERSADVRGLQVRTLNAMALAIVNGSAPFARRAQQYRTIDEPDVRRIIGRLVSFPRKRNADPIAPWIEALGLVRLGLRSPTEVESIYDGDIDGFAAFYPRYLRELESQGALDFDQQVHEAIRILLAEPAARATAQRACRVLLVDEFQDLTPAHLLLVRLLAGPDGSVFGVGDDDQTIYGYNGADPAWLIDFAQLFPLAEMHPLEVNYRCPADVVESADRLLRHNVRRVAKVIRSAHPGTTGLHVARPTVDTVDTTVAVVRGAVANGRAPSEVAVLTRVNSLLAPVQAALVGHGIPVTGGVGAEFVDRTAVRSVLAWMRLGMGLWSGGDLQEALRRPSRPMHPNAANWVTEQHDVDGLLRLANRLNNDRDAQRVREFALDIERVRAQVTSGGSTADVVALVRDSIGLGGAVQTLDQSRHGMNRAAQSDDLTALEQLARLHPEVPGFEQWLRDTLGRPWSSGGVVLATVHRVKGQEWPVVVVHQADADQYPHRLATDEEEEERRLFHVAVTRTSESVTVVSGPSPSPFIAELSNEPPERKPRIVSSNAPERRGSAVTKPGTTRSSSSGRSSDKKPGEGLSPKASLAFAKLKDLRRELAKGKPAYTVFDDATLERIALAQPSSLAELGGLRGIGPAKLDQYGAAVLAVIEDVAAES